MPVTTRYRAGSIRQFRTRRTHCIDPFWGLTG
jgi:hypothetical protein